jgi:hypothetical protein
VRGRVRSGRPGASGDQSKYGSSAVVVGVGCSAYVGGGARRRRGIRPAHGAIIQSNGSGSFTRDQGRYVREEF